MSMWSAFALMAATIWDRMPRALRLAGAVMIAFCGFAICALALISLRAADPGGPRMAKETTFSAWHVLQNMPGRSLEMLWPMACIVATSLVAFASVVSLS